MSFIIRTPNGDYWSNSNGWTEHRNWATYFDKSEDAEVFVAADTAELRPYVQQVPNATAGYAAFRATLIDNDGDDYGWSMSWLFAICDWIMFKTEASVPSSWGFRPSPMGYSSDDEYKEEILADWSDFQLLYVGEVLHRYIEILKKNGKDY